MTQHPTPNRQAGGARSQRQRDELLALTDLWAVRSLDAELKSRRVYQPPGLEYDDLLVIARTAAWVAATEYDPTIGTALRSWVISEVRYAVQEACRSRRYDGARPTLKHRVKFVSTEVLVNDDGKPLEFADPKDPYAPAEAVMIAAVLRRRLPKRTYAIFREYFGNGRDARDVGKEHGIGSQRVYQIVAEGRKQAREAIG